MPWSAYTNAAKPILLTLTWTEALLSAGSTTVEVKESSPLKSELGV